MSKCKDSYDTVCPPSICDCRTKTLTDEEIVEIAKDCGYANWYELNIKFARAILRKAQEK